MLPAGSSRRVSAQSNGLTYTARIVLYSGGMTSIYHELLLSLLMLLVYAVGAGIFTLLVPTMQTIGNRARLKRQLADRTIAVEYEPPLRLSPAAIGYMHDGHLGAREVYAMTLYLEQKGYIKRLKSSGEQMLVIVNSMGDDASPSYQKTMQFVGQQPSINDRAAFETFATELEKATHGELVSLDIFSKRGAWSDAKYVTLIISGFVAVTIVCGAYAITHSLSDSELNIMVQVYLTLAIISVGVMVALAMLSEKLQMKLFGPMSYASTKLYEIWPFVEGFRLYLQEVELDHIRFENEQDRTVGRNEALPYSIALNLKSGWEKWFRG